MKRLLCLLLTALLILTAALAAAEEPETRLTDYVTSLMAGDDNDALYAQLDGAMQAAIPRDEFDLLWPQLLDICGDFVGYHGATEVKEVAGYTVLTQPLDMADSDLLCTMSLHDDGTIAGLMFTFYELPAEEEETVQLPYAVKEESVRIGERPWQVSGTLLIPESDKPVPAVVLVQGSGATDRDESIYAVKPFRDIARALAPKGIAVLRYDKRTYTYRGQLVGATSFRTLSVEEEVIQDAIFAGRLLAADSRIDPQRIYIMGHSLGAMLAPRIVAESGGVFSGMILAAGTNRSFLDVLLRQATEVGGISERERAELIADGEAIYGITTAEEAQQSMFNGLYDYYYWEMLQYPTPAEYLEELALPTLIINGSRDIQVIEQEGRDTWEEVLDMDAPWLSYYWTDVNHMLMRPDVAPSKMRTVDEYKVNCTVAEDVTDRMADFILNTEE